MKDMMGNDGCQITTTHHKAHFTLSLAQVHKQMITNIANIATSQCRKMSQNFNGGYEWHHLDNKTNYHTESLISSECGGKHLLNIVVNSVVVDCLAPFGAKTSAGRVISGDCGRCKSTYVLLNPFALEVSSSYITTTYRTHTLKDMYFYW